MSVSDALERVLADMRRRLDDDPETAAVREAAAEAVSDAEESDQSLEGTDVDALVTAYRERFAEEVDVGGTPADHSEASAVDDADAADRTENTVSSDETNETEADEGGGTGRAGDPERDEPRRVTRVAHFRDSVRTAGEWTETVGEIGPGVFDVASDAQTTEGMNAQLAAQFADVDYEVQSYTLGPDDRHPSWTQIRVTEQFDPSRLPRDVTIRKVEDVP